MKIFFACFLVFLTTNLFSQTIDYRVEIVSFQLIDCNDGIGFDEEPTWKAWGRDDINTTFVGGTCFQQDANAPFVHNVGNTLLISQNATNATTIDIKLEGWEDDNVFAADRCTFDSGDDCHVNTIFPSISFKNDPHCQWNTYSFTSGDFIVNVRINWQYTMFEGGFDVIDCGTTIPLSAQGSGSWSVYSGTSGSFVNINDPATNFSGSANSSYVLLWKSLPECLTIYTPDTLQVDFISAPNPNLVASSTSICEGDPVNFTAQNGSLYDWSLNSIGNVVLSDGSGIYTLTPSITDNVVYVSVSNGICASLDSISFTVLTSPIPTITDNSGVLSTQAFLGYLWYFNGTVIPGATNMDYTPTQSGSYYVEVINSNGCFGQSTPITFTGIDKFSINLSIFPNPTNGIVNIQTEKSIESLKVFNSIGKEENVDFINNTLDISHLSNGIYIISLSIDNQIITKRIILSK